jgi:hypothetical protein
MLRPYAFARRLNAVTPGSQFVLSRLRIPIRFPLYFASASWAKPSPTRSTVGSSVKEYYSPCEPFTVAVWWR